DQTPSEPGNFDLDLVHASFVDFISTGGGDNANNQELPATDADSSAPILMPSMSGDLFALSGTLTKTPAQTSEPSSSTKPPVSAPVSEKAPAATEDDDSAVDRTIEEWLSEPSKVLVPNSADDNTPSTTTTN